MSNHILMNVVDEQEMRVALIRDGHLESIVHERLAGDGLHLGNIYLGRVANVEKSLDAAFIDLDAAKNGFLHVDDVRHDQKKGSRIERVLKPGQQILVQITKEPIKDKGPCLTMNLSIPGRYLVLVQDPEGLGVSKRIDDPALRRRLKKLLAGFEPPAGFGYIVRTAGADRSDDEITLDSEYLARLWQDIEAKAKRVQAPACVYREADVVVRTLRELADEEAAKVILDSEEFYDEARAFSMVFMPELSERIELHREELPIFTYYGVEERLATIYDRQVQLPSGGTIVIEQTEALVSIDVNSSRSRDGADVHATALDTNLEAVLTIAEQLVLRDLGGLIIIDFIDMDDRDHQRLVQLALRKALTRDKAKTSVAAMSRFGLVEMTRQRTRPSHKMAASQECPYCRGTGAIKTPETVEIEVMRAVREALAQGDVAKVDVVVPADLAVGLLNDRGAEIAALGHQYEARIQVTADSLIKAREFRLTTVAKKRGRRRKKEEKPVHPGLLASWLESKAKARSEVAELKEKGPAALERELNELANGRPVAKPVAEATPTEPVVAATAVSAPAPAAGPPALLEEAAELRRLLFSVPRPVDVVSALASDGKSSITPSSSGGRGNGNRRRRRRNGR